MPRLRQYASNWASIFCQCTWPTNLRNLRWSACVIVPRRFSAWLLSMINAFIRSCMRARRLWFCVVRDMYNTRNLKKMTNRCRSRLSIEQSIQGFLESSVGDSSCGTRVAPSDEESFAKHGVTLQTGIKISLGMEGEPGRE